MLAIGEVRLIPIADHVIDHGDDHPPGHGVLTPGGERIGVQLLDLGPGAVMPASADGLPVIIGGQVGCDSRLVFFCSTTAGCSHSAPRAL